MPLSQMNISQQLTAWARDEREFRAAAAKADAERLEWETKIKALRVQGKQLSEESREASNALGQHHGIMQSYRDEKARLQAQMQHERAELEQCAKDTEKAMEQAKREKISFCKETEELSMELQYLIEQKELRCLESLMTVESVKHVFGDCDALKSLEQATIQNEAVQQEIADQETKLENIRALVLEHHHPVSLEQLRHLNTLSAQVPNSMSQPLTENDLRSLELMWQNEDESHQHQHQHHAEPVHNELFYNGPAEANQ